MTLTDTQIREFLRQATLAGSLDHIAVCERALAGDKAARRVVAWIIPLAIVRRAA